MPCSVRMLAITGRSVATDPAVHLHFVAHQTAEQLETRHAEHLPLMSHKA